MLHFFTFLFISTAALFLYNLWYLTNEKYFWYSVGTPIVNNFVTQSPLLLFSDILSLFIWKLQLCIIKVKFCCQFEFLSSHHNRKASFSIMIMSKKEKVLIVAYLRIKCVINIVVQLICSYNRPYMLFSCLLL